MLPCLCWPLKLEAVHKPDVTPKSSATSTTSTLASVNLPYWINKELGSGGFGVVYKAYSDETGEDAAIKAIDYLNASGRPFPDVVQNFNYETAALALVSQPNRTHPNIVQCIEPPLG